MANTIDFILTNAAKELLAKVLDGKTLNFTRMAIGDGYSFDTTVAKGFTTLVNEVLSLDITKKEILDEESVKITSAFSNTDADAEFYYREVGLFAEDPDTKEEVLYAYGNRNDAAELITPAGNNIVTKQLMFIVTVGDSANVTFNINQNIYALQTDMVDVHTDINQVQTDIEEIQNNIDIVQNNIEGVQNNITTLHTGKADKSLVNTGMITNCLLEVPQNIKLELSNGVLTLKAGSKVYIPNGFETDGTTPKFDEIIVNNDNILGYDTKVDNLILCWDTINNLVVATRDIYISSDSTAPIVENNARFIWYDTENNLIKTCILQSNWTIGLTLPFAIANCTGTNTFKITQVFNGFGYVGSIAFVLPGIKCLIPNGRNNDGTLNNIEIKIDKLSIKDTFEDISKHCFINETGEFITYGSDNYFESDAQPVFDGNICRWFDTKRNLMFITEDAGNNWLKYIYKHVYIGELFKNKNSNITYFKPKTTFRAVDYNEYHTKIAELESRLTALENV